MLYGVLKIIAVYKIFACVVRRVNVDELALAGVALLESSKEADHQEETMMMMEDHHDAHRHQDHKHQGRSLNILFHVL